MIEIKNLNKEIGGRLILDNITFSVKKGEILGFLGPNGAGKTTTMKIITAFWPASSGVVEVEGLDVEKNSLRIREKIGYLPETVPLYEEMRVDEYLRFVAAVRGVKKDSLKQRVKETTNACGLAEVERSLIEELSKGYRQRVGLAQAIIHNPEILVLDEPTSGLDPNQIAEIRNLIKNLGREKTVLFSTHILSEASALCDRIIIINNGRIVGEGAPADLVARVGTRELIYIKIKGKQDDVFDKLKTMEDIIKLEAADQEAEDICGYEIELKPGVDLRERLSLLVMNSGWSILEFNKKSASLEDVFRELTTGSDTHNL